MNESLTDPLTKDYLITIMPAERADEILKNQVISDYVKQIEQEFGHELWFIHNNLKQWKENSEKWNELKKQWDGEEFDVLGSLTDLTKLEERLKNKIEYYDKEIKHEEDNLKNIASGFKDYTYRLIDKMKDKKQELQKIIDVDVQPTKSKEQCF